MVGKRSRNDSPELCDCMSSLPQSADSARHDRLLRHSSLRLRGQHISCSGAPRRISESDPFVTQLNSRPGTRPSQTRQPARDSPYPGTGHWLAEHDREDAFKPEAARTYESSLAGRSRAVSEDVFACPPAWEFGESDEHVDCEVFVEECLEVAAFDDLDASVAGGEVAAGFADQLVVTRTPLATALSFMTPDRVIQSRQRARRIYAVTRGHRTIFLSPHNPRSSSGGRTVLRTDTHAKSRSVAVVLGRQSS